MASLSVAEQIIEVASDKHIYQVLCENNVTIRSSCGGVGACGDCIIKVVKGEENLNDFNSTEKKYLGNIYHITKERLSCQCTMKGDVAIEIV
jgi:ferredoxin, 2Fe-2S